MDDKEFEILAQEVLGFHVGKPLRERRIVFDGGGSKKFDLVSDDLTMIGDAKFYGPSGYPPSGKLATVAEFVWLLQHVAQGERRFLVFGGNRQVPDAFLKRWGPALTGPIEFYFVSEDRSLTVLRPG